MAVRLELLTMWLALALYAGATVLYAYHFLSKRASFSWYATFLTGAGFILQTASIGLHSSAIEGSRLLGPYSIVLAAWALVLVYFVVEHLVRLKVYGVVLVPAALLLLLLAQLLGASAFVVRPRPEELALLDSWRVGVHVALIVFANAGFAIGAAASAAYLGLELQLKKHRTSTLFKRLPSLAQTDLVARRAISFSFPAYVAGLMLGILRAVETDVAGWWADPRVMVSGVVFAIFGFYLYLHYGRGASGRSTALVALFGFVFVVALSIIARTVPAGFHVFAVAGS
jgi:ABC-type transport system involved in cytochrome c biogenesis permease subunit